MSCSCLTCVKSSVFLCRLYVLMCFSFNKYCYYNYIDFEFYISFVTFKYESPTYMNVNGLDLVQFSFKAHQICLEFWGWKTEFSPVLNIIFRLLFTWPKFHREKRRNDKITEKFSTTVALIRSTAGISARFETVLN
jgi:hypothetical protein